MLFKLPDPKTPLIKLKQAIASKTGIEPSQQTLYMHGAFSVLYSGGLELRYTLTGFKMKDDNAALERYGLYEPGDGNPKKSSSPFSSLMRGFSTSWMPPKKSPPKHITLMSSPDASATVSDRLPSTTFSGAKQPARPQQPQIDESSVVQNIARISTDVLTRLQPDIDRYGELCSKGEPTGHLYSMLSETLLQALLKLDGLEVNSEWQQARAQRKQAVKDVQAALDLVDGHKEGTAS